MSGLRIDTAACVGCGKCQKSCPFGALSMIEKHAVCDSAVCTLCQACISSCAFQAISVDENYYETSGFAGTAGEYHGVWVFTEQWQGNLHSSARELLTEGRRLASELGEPLTAVCLGEKVEELVEELVSYGATEVLLCEEKELAVLEENRYSAVVSDLIQEKKPAVVLYGATTFGRGLAPMVAAKLETGLTADCTRLAINPETRLFEQTRPAFGGNVMATIVCKKHRPQMATVRPGVFKSSRLSEEDLKAAKLSAKIERFTPDPAIFQGMPVIEGVEAIKDDTVRLGEAEMIFAGGAGLETKENFEKLEQAARKYGAAVGASRGAVDCGFAAHASQVGQTGTVVSPKLYLAAGISGAIQHIVGMQNADCIVAINTDPDAPIFQVADIGITGDAAKALDYLNNI